MTAIITCRPHPAINSLNMTVDFNIHDKYFGVGGIYGSKKFTIFCRVFIHVTVVFDFAQRLQIILNTPPANAIAYNKNFIMSG